MSDSSSPTPGFPTTRLRRLRYDPRVRQLVRHTELSPQKLILLKSYQQLIEKHYRTIRLPKEYAELLYITPNHLNALCRDLLSKTAGELIRDRIVLELAHRNKIPLVASMGGGYSADFRDIIEAHANTYRLAQEIFF